MNQQTAVTSFAHSPIGVRWTTASRFEAGRPGGPHVQIDGDAEAAPGPVDLLLAAIASCAATDVVAILAKQRTPVQSLEVTVESTRAESTPRRLLAVVLHFSIRASGATHEKATRAIELSVNKYCSVRSSLASDIPVTFTLDLNR